MKEDLVLLLKQSLQKQEIAQKKIERDTHLASVKLMRRGFQKTLKEGIICRQTCMLPQIGTHGEAFSSPIGKLPVKTSAEDPKDFAPRQSNSSFFSGARRARSCKIIISHE